MQEKDGKSKTGKMRKIWRGDKEGNGGKERRERREYSDGKKDKEN